MSQPFKRSFRVRYHECDAYGHVNNTVYVQYLRECIEETLAAAGCGAAEQAARGLYWRAQATDIEFLRPVRYGETVEAGAWPVASTGNRLWMACEFRVAGAPELAARAQTTLALANGADEAAGLPQGLSAGPGLAGLPEAAPAWDAFPEAPPPPPGTYRMRRRVLWQELDMARRVDEARVLKYLDDAGFGVIEAHGWPTARMVAHGFGILLRRHQVEHLAPLRLDDELVVSTWASDIRRATALRHYSIARAGGGALLVRAHTLGVWVDLASGRPIRIPAGFMDDFAPNLVY